MLEYKFFELLLFLSETVIDDIDIVESIEIGGETDFDIVEAATLDRIESLDKTDEDTLGEIVGQTRGDDSIVFIKFMSDRDIDNGSIAIIAAAPDEGAVGLGAFDSDTVAAIGMKDRHDDREVAGSLHNDADHTLGRRDGHTSPDALILALVKHKIVGAFAPRVLDHLSGAVVIMLTIDGIVVLEDRGIVGDERGGHVSAEASILAEQDLVFVAEVEIARYRGERGVPTACDRVGPPHHDRLLIIGVRAYEYQGDYFEQKEKEEEIIFTEKLD